MLLAPPSTTRGYSLVEVLVAISVLLIALIGPLTIAYNGLKSNSLAKDVNTAFFLAQEGLEVVTKMREDAALTQYTGAGTPPWNGNLSVLQGALCTAAAPCGVDIETTTLFDCSDRTCQLYEHEGGRARFAHDASGGEATSFQRELIMTPGAGEVRVQSIVTWGEAADQRVELETYIYNIYDL
jgi:prepilin-type N-terminal cleavage/methylation domain-containing protein